MEAKAVKYIAIHCSAGYGNVESIVNYWKNNLGWKSPGYHILIDLDGKKHYLQPFDKQTNGVRHYNHETLHISYIGGVHRDDYNTALDSRTDKQKISILEALLQALSYLARGGCDISKVMILGHRDFSADQNCDGVIDSWERIKECPSFDAINEYLHFLPGENIEQLLPYNR